MTGRSGFRLPRYDECVLGSGMRIRASRWGSRPTAAIAVVFPRGGSIWEPAGSLGISEITVESLLGGTASRTAQELAETLDDLAALLDLSAGFDSTVARFYLLEPDLQEGLELLSELLFSPGCPESELEKVKSRMQDAIESQRSDPDFVVQERMVAALYGDHAYGHLLPDPDFLARATLDDVTSFHRAAFDPSEATVILSGQIPTERAMETLRRVFEPLRGPTTPSLPGPPGAEAPAAPLPPDPRTSREAHLIERPESVQTSLALARRSVPRKAPDYVAAVVANQVLGGGPSSRLFARLREERGLTYGAFSTFTSRLRASHFMASIDCATEKTPAALSLLIEILEEFAASGPTPEEHEKARNFLTGSFVLARETPGGILQDEITRFLHGLPEDEWETWCDRVQAVTRDEARQAAERHMSPGSAVLVAAGDRAGIEASLREFGPLTIWDPRGTRLE